MIYVVGFLLLSMHDGYYVRCVCIHIHIVYYVCMYLFYNCIHTYIGNQVCGYFHMHTCEWLVCNKYVCVHVCVYTSIYDVGESLDIPVHLGQAQI